MQSISIDNKEFIPYISKDKITLLVEHVAQKINNELCNEDVVFIGVLNGSFIFMADLIREINFHVTISFIKLASYQADKSSGEVKQIIGLNIDLKGKTVVIVEDIIDTGITLEYLLKQIEQQQPAKIKVASMFFKPKACKMPVHIDYLGTEIPNDFVIGYGLDYNGFGRNLPDLYRLKS
ncbi:MAG TPA: hypoxanthine phosphoribosyltransferase [Bacteroidales bacterium]|nr:hypoxanthine phosphoribosyltransferase [Bacteroidales bacterium]